jgi:nucleotide-binding universal stress UspA family protein
MKKILLAFDGSHFSEGAFEFASRINEQQNILLTGVFLPLVDASSLWSYAGGTGRPFIPLLEDEQSAEVMKNIERFKTLCQKNNIEYRVHKDFLGFALPELKRESRFADLVILGSESFYQSFNNGEPNDYLKDALHDAECPVLVIPEKFDFPDYNILTYDGSDSSVYAIKQFAYLFPEFVNNNTMLIHLNDGDKPIPDESNVEELVSRHFPNLTIFKLELPSAKYFSTWASEKKNAILVSGAFGRSFMSQMLKKSFISGVIREHKLPIFIAHR